MGVRAKGLDKRTMDQFVLFSIDEEDLKHLRNGEVLVVKGHEVNVDFDIHLAFGTDDEVQAMIAPALASRAPEEIQ